MKKFVIAAGFMLAAVAVTLVVSSKFKANKRKSEDELDLLRSLILSADDADKADFYISEMTGLESYKDKCKLLQKLFNYRIIGEDFTGVHGETDTQMWANNYFGLLEAILMSHGRTRL